MNRMAEVRILKLECDSCGATTTMSINGKRVDDGKTDLWVRNAKIHTNGLSNPPLETCLCPSCAGAYEQAIYDLNLAGGSK